MFNPINEIENLLKSSTKPFIVERNKYFGISKAELFAYRKASMLGKDYLFFHDLSNHVNIELDQIVMLHESARQFVNSSYKWPKAWRFVVPNIVTFVIASKAFSFEIIEYAQKPTRTYVGGEIHSVYLIDIEGQTVFGQGSSFSNVNGFQFEFKNINPQNRALAIAGDIGKMLFS